MFNFFWTWLDPKILTMEKWVNVKAISVAYIDIDLDKVKKGEVRNNDMFRRVNLTPSEEKDEQVYGPFLTNLIVATTLGYLRGPGTIEAFGLLDQNGELWWRHRIDGATEDFKVGAFSDMEEFFTYAHADTGLYWECVLRTQALLDTDSKEQPEFKINEIKAELESRVSSKTQDAEKNRC